ncbi:MAG: SDR family NAD(P)-dependent oxidoreductase [Sporichthyaceae bacterium]
MTVDLKGKVALVTGGNRGIGRAIALGLAEAGADVVLAARDTTTLSAVAKEIEAVGARADFNVVDIADGPAVRAMVDGAVERLGRLDIVVNNSGIVSSKALLELDEDEWDRVLNTNLRGTFLVTQATGRHLVAQGSGKVINIGSNFAFKGVANHAAYCASKAAVIAFTKCMAVEWARHNIQVNALAPGYFETDLNAGVRSDTEANDRIVRTVPARRMGVPDELVPWALLLASPASDYMTGESIVIDGGLTAR